MSIEKGGNEVGNVVDIRDELLNVSSQFFSAKISQSVMNVEVLLQKQVGVAEHADIMQTIEDEMSKIAHYKDLLEVVEDYFR
jgi:hypothetical protein